jgi:plastocyanin
VLLATSPVYSMYIHFPTAASSSSPVSSTSPPSGGTPAGVTCANPCNIYILNSIFGYNVSQTLTIKAGTTVTWHNIDDTEHTSTSDSGIWNSGIIPVGGSFSRTFNSTGTFPYHCLIHPMTATIIVVS